VEDELPVEEPTVASFKLPLDIGDIGREPGSEAVVGDGSQPDCSLPSCHVILLCLIYKNGRLFILTWLCVCVIGEFLIGPEI